jgi:redox-sensitive bicupin YhaK (pirin superfamily)
VGDFLVMRGTDRFVSTEPGLTSRHSFSFGRHYDPSNIGFGLLVMNNDDVAQPGAGYTTHPHRDVEIVTWVLEGALVHRDSTGSGGVVYPGLAQRLSAGRGVEHSEFNDAPTADGRLPGGVPLRFVQMWVPPSEPGVDPSYEQRDVSAQLAATRGLVTVASGMPRHQDVAAVELGQRAAAMHVVELTLRDVVAGSRAEGVTLPGAPFVHVYVARGAVDVEGIGRLDEGDAVRITDEGGRSVVAVDKHPTRSAVGHGGALGAAPGAQLIVWEMHASVVGGPPPR